MTEAVDERFAKTALKARSGAYQWLRRNHEKIAAVFSGQSRPAWKALVETAADDDLHFTANTLRKAWVRVERDLARETGRKKTLATRDQTGLQSATPFPALQPPTLPMDDADIKAQFGPIGGGPKTDK